MQRTSFLMGLSLLLSLLLFSCTDTSNQPMYKAKTYAVYPDRVEQGAYMAKASDAQHLSSTYQSPANATYSRRIEFKFSINGKDNELPVGVNHYLVLRPQNGKVEAPVIPFGEADATIPEAPEGDFLEPNTELLLQVDMREVLRQFEEQGYYEDIHGERIAATDFKGVFVAGSSDPLSWDFENLRSRPQMQLSDEDGDGIYSLRLMMNAYNPDNFTEASWAQSKDLSAWPSYTSDQVLIDALHQMSLEEMLDDIRPDGAFMAGEKWEGVWTRDISYSIVLSLALLHPEASKKSLMAKVKNNRIIQDTGTGGSWPVSTDRMTWALAAWEVFLATGDRDWLEQSYKIISNSVNDDLLVARNKTNNLMYGESSFLDWRKQSYPRWMQPRDIYLSHCLGTNVVHYQTYYILSQMAENLGKDQGRFAVVAQELKEAINTHLWQEEKGYYGQFLYGDRGGYALSPRSEALGEALAILYGVAEGERAQTVATHTPVLEYGIPSIYPQIPGVPPYHNDGVWPFVQAYWNWAQARAGNEKGLEHGLAALYRAAALFVTNKENFVAGTGDFKGTEINSDRQLWSVAGNLAMIYRVYFGMQPDSYGLNFAPVVPRNFAGEKHLSNFRYRKALLDITLSGYGNKIASFTLDGEEVAPYLSADLEGAHTIVIEMSNEDMGANEFNLAENHYTAATPQPELAGDAISWPAVEGASIYKVYFNGKLLREQKEMSFSVADLDPATAIQIGADDSFLSEPIIPALFSESVNIVEAEGKGRSDARGLIGYSGKGYLPLSRDENTEVIMEVKVPRSGKYRLDFRYSNGNGPINTDNKCAIRSLYLQNQYLGAVVMPQRGYEEWSNWGYSNPFYVQLEKGRQVLRLKLDAWNANMNGEVNSALLDHLRLVQVLDEE